MGAECEFRSAKREDCLSRSAPIVAHPAGLKSEYLEANARNRINVHSINKS
jgi:hypothetical protein